MHHQLNDGMSKEFEVYDEINLFLKVRIKDRELPCKLTFFYDTTTKRRHDLTIFYSQESKDPSRGINSASAYNVSQSSLVDFSYFSLK